MAGDHVEFCLQERKRAEGSARSTFTEGTDDP
jgi:hypothetical protein